MTKIKYHSRKFLNKTNGTASIEVDVDSYDWCGGGVDARVSITDCSRRITLDFSVYTKKDVVEKTQKLEVLINELSKLKALLMDNAEVICDAIAVADKKRKESSKKQIKSEVVAVEL